MDEKKEAIRKYISTLRIPRHSQGAAERKLKTLSLEEIQAKVKRMGQDLA